LVRMRLRLSTLFAAFSFVLLTAQLALAATPEVGQAAPEFRLATPAGEALSLSQFTKTGPVVLVVLRGFPGYQCPFCTKQVHAFVAKAEAFAAAGAEVILVYPGPQADLGEHAKEFLAMQAPLPNNVHLVIDPDYKFTDQYGLRWDAPQETAYPSTFVLDRHGKVVYRKISKEHGDRTTPEDVLAQIPKRK